MDRRFDLIIVGAGPGGLTAALYGSRAGLKTALIERAMAGGKLNKTHQISNWPGSGTLEGMQLAQQMHEHALEYGAEYLYGDVIRIEDGEYKKVVTAGGEVYETKTVILATGTVERPLGIPGEAELLGRGVSYCAVCDGGFFRDKVVTVIGGGNSALEEAIYLAGHASKVYVVIRRNVFRAHEVIVSKILENPKFEVIYEHIPVELKARDDKLETIVLQDVNNGALKEIFSSGIFPYIGADPLSEAVSELDVTDENAYVLVNEQMETVVPGLYAIGDVTAKTLRQVVTAANDGAIAAQAAFHYVRGR